MPYTWFTPQSVYCGSKVYVYKTFLVCLDLQTLEWTEIRETPCSSDYMYTVTPHYFEGYIYEFPYFDLEIDWFYEFELGKTHMQRMCVQTGKIEEIEYNDSIQFGNRAVVCNGKFYTVNRNNDDFVSGYLNDFSVCKKLGKQGKAGNVCVIVAVPHYPHYKINK